MRIIGLDYGSVTCGVALSDESFLIASPMETIRYKEMDELLSKLDVYFSKYEIGVIVLGNPINLDGSISKRSEITLEFKTINDAISTLKSQLDQNTPIYFVGDGAILNKDLIESDIRNCIFTDKNNLNSYSLGIAGYISYISGQKPSVMPLYLRKSQAERALEEKKKRSDA